MYFSYLILFSKFFIDRYSTKREAAHGKAAAAAAAAAAVDNKTKRS
jgi:hypothetical protein